MKAKEIRELGKLFRERNGKEFATIADGSAVTVALMEIAAQIAETNEKLDIILDPPLLWDKTQLDPDVLKEGLSHLPQGRITVMEPRATLRDQFAMAALAGNWNDLNEITNEAFAKWAYQVADSMLEARK